MLLKECEIRVCFFFRMLISRRVSNFLFCSFIYRNKLHKSFKLNYVLKQLFLLIEISVQKSIMNLR